MVPDSSQATGVLSVTMAALAFIIGAGGTVSVLHFAATIEPGPQATYHILVGFVLIIVVVGAAAVLAITGLDPIAGR